MDFRYALLTLIVLFSVSGNAGNKNVYKVGVENIDYYPHYAFGHRPSSFTHELITAFFEQNGLKVEFVPLPLKRFNQWLSSEEIDFKYPDNEFWRVEENPNIPIIYSDEVAPSVAGGITKVSNVSLQKADIKRLGSIAGFYSMLWIDDIKNKKVTLVEQNNVISVIKLALHDMVDIINLDYSVVNFHLNDMGQSGALVMLPHLPNRKISFRLSTISHPQLIAKFNDFLAHNQSFVEQLKRKYQIIDDPLALRYNSVSQP